MKKQIIFLAILLIIILTIISLQQFQIINQSQPPPTITNQPTQTTLNSPLSTTNIILKNQQFILEIAQTPLEKQQGLMFRKSLSKNQGMLFLYDIESPKTFWMKNTLIPLDLIFINSSYHITDIKENFQPCIKEPCQTYTSKPAKNIIELNAGLVNELGLKIGDEITINYNSLVF